MAMASPVLEHSKDGLFRVEKQGTCIPTTFPSLSEECAGSSCARLLHHEQPILYTEVEVVTSSPMPQASQVWGTSRDGNLDSSISKEAPALLDLACRLLATHHLVSPSAMASLSGISSRTPLALFFFFCCCCCCCFAATASAQLSSSFYNASCPNALPIIQSAVKAAVAKERRMGASLLRLHFHDCFVQASPGCDGSVLLDDTSGLTGEKTAGPNNNSLRGFDVVDAIKSKLESACKQVVSCADILAVAARDSVVALGGPSWTVQLGRRDSTTASFSSANSDIPRPDFNLTDLISAFSNKGLATTDMVALSGAHTIGQARCTTFRARIYNDTDIDSSLAASLRSSCPSSGDDDSLAPLDASTPTAFDTCYYRNLLSNKGLLHSDQQLHGGGSTDSQVSSYAANSAKFFGDFASAMVKMGSISPLTGSSGCSKIH
ncbi:hypothetical protein MUK42_13983 [Musa troglodytarum]|uniref:peroxidase n=1 Tax=Musa troglodytarum TaxID=320322 RepID=A0A9E7ICU8_9LILI|nr:hypothetical protein MUK42_13983 [Musa troglodytarum]